MTVPGSEQPNPSPNPEAAQPAPRSAVDATKYVGTPAVGTSKAAAAGGLSSAGPSNTDIDRRRRRLVWVGVTAFLTAWFLGLLPILSSPHSLRTQTRFQDRLSLGVRARSRYQVPAEISHLGRSHTRPRVRDLCALHAPGLHAGLEAEREQVQVSVPRQRL
jgi:hypothetical protein